MKPIFCLKPYYKNIFLRIASLISFPSIFPKGIKEYGLNKDEKNDLCICHGPVAIQNSSKSITHTYLLKN